MSTPFHACASGPEVVEQFRLVESVSGYFCGVGREGGEKRQGKRKERGKEESVRTSPRGLVSGLSLSEMRKV